MSDAIAPCPFCGNATDFAVRTSTETNTGSQVVKCWGCGAWGPYGSSHKAMAIAAWNERAHTGGEETVKELKL